MHTDKHSHSLIVSTVHNKNVDATIALRQVQSFLPPLNCCYHAPTDTVAFLASAYLSAHSSVVTLANTSIDDLVKTHAFFSNSSWFHCFHLKFEGDVNEHR